LEESPPPPPAHNPWLDIPATDYEGHMASPPVGQLQLLNQLFARTLAETRPAALAILGCTTGNGFEHLDFSVTRHVLAVDINPDYLRIARARFASERLQFKCADLNAGPFDDRRYDLVHAALVFEYVQPEIVLAHIVRALKPGGLVSVVLQLPNPGLPSVSRTAYTSLEKLSPIFQHYPRVQFSGLARAAGLQETAGETITLPSGKEFYFGKYRITA
jgi:ubiquinone/menaquinone biosynthesis C-methylase UbiE